MVELLQQYYKDILIVVLFCFSMLALYKNGKRETVKRIVLSLVVQAEKSLGSGTGELKFAYVTEKVYYYLPSLVKVLFTKKEIDGYIDEGVQVLKSILSSGATLEGYDEELKKKSMSR